MTVARDDTIPIPLSGHEAALQLAASYVSHHMK